MLVDAAKGGDVEIPVFCYEPKLGGPVGACRMCLVEIEGIPKLQTACSTPVRDGMVVYTRTDRVIEAQNAVVEFLLVNHPLDCPVCDKGGECPLQDIAMGWGPGRSRVTDPKRHFRKPMPLSPLVRIDRERCILCYRCVRFSQEVAEDEQLQLLERGSSSYVGTFDDRPYIAPFHGNIIELCPVGALTSEAYRFRARPWDIEDSGSICTLCPSQCNVKFTVRDERVQRVLARDNARGRQRLALRQGPLRLPDDRLRGADHRAAAERQPRPAGTQALDAAAERLRAAGERTAAIVGGQSLQRGGLPGPADRPRGARLGQRDLRSTSSPPGALAALSAPELGASIADIDEAESILVVGADPLHAMPILDLRLRRPSATRTPASWSPPSARPRSTAAPRRPPATRPASAAAFLAALAAELGAGPGARGPAPSGDAERLAGELRPGKTVDRLGRAPRPRPGGAAALDALLELPPGSSTLRRAPAAACSAFPRAPTLAACARSAACPAPGPGFAAADPTARPRADQAGPARRPSSTAMILLNADPVRDLARRPGLGRGAAPGAHRDRDLDLRRRLDRRLPTSSSRPRPTPRRRARSPTPTGACSACAPPSRAPARCARCGRCWPSSPPRLGDETGIDSAPEALDSDRRRGALLRRPHPRRDRRHRGALAGAPQAAGDRASRRGREPAAVGGTRHRGGHRPRPAATHCRDGDLRLGTYQATCGRRGDRAQRRAAVPGAGPEGRAGAV